MPITTRHGIHYATANKPDAFGVYPALESLRHHRATRLPNNAAQPTTVVLLVHDKSKAISPYISHALSLPKGPVSGRALFTETAPNL